jgi:hypothetical protein
MSAKMKTVLKGFDYMHCDDFAKYLSDMAAKGWHFKEWSAGLKFEKGKPERVIYSVEVFTKASEIDMCPELHTQEFAEYCESAGWEFVDAKQKFCIFRKIDEQAVPLFTPEERVNNAVKGMFSGTSISLLVIYGINACLQWTIFSKMFARNIFSGVSTFSVLVWTVMFVYQLLTLGDTVLKKIKLKQDIRAGKLIYIGNCEDGKYHLKLRDIYIILLVVLLMYCFFVMGRMELVLLNVGIIVSVIGFSVIISKVRPQRDTNLIVQVIFTIILMVSIMFSIMCIFSLENGSIWEKDTMPLRITDYRDCDDVIEDTSYLPERNFLGSLESYYIFGNKTSVCYDVYKSKHTKILDKIWEEETGIMKFYDDIVDCTSDWGAELALRNEAGVYYVRYENSILVFSDDEDVYLTKEQIKIIREKLDLR